MMQPNRFMPQAHAQAQAAMQAGEVPVGAVIVDIAGQVVAAAHNLVETQADPTAHAELLAIREACGKRGTKYLEDCDLYVTLEPCAMCAQALAFARIRRLYFGAYDAKGGGVEHGARIFQQATCHHRPEVYGGLMEQECGALLKTFFAEKRV